MHLSRWALQDKSRLSIHQRDVSWAHYRSIETSSKSVKQSIVCNYFFVGGLSVNCIRISFLESTRSYCRPTSISRRNITPHLCSCTPGTSPSLLVSYTWNCREQVKEDLLVQIQKKTVLRSAWFFSTSWVAYRTGVYLVDHHSYIFPKVACLFSFLSFSIFHWKMSIVSNNSIAKPTKPTLYPAELE